MRCECCDKNLDNEESTAKFFNEDRTAEPRYVNMCRGCRKFLPPEIRIITRSDFDKEDDDFEQDIDLTLMEYDDDEE